MGSRSVGSWSVGSSGQPGDVVSQPLDGERTTTIGPPSGGDDTEEATVRALYQKLIDAWNAGSGDRFAAAFIEDGHLVGFDGVHFQGREQIATFQQQLFDKWMKGSRLVGGVEEVRFLSPDVALVHAEGNTVARRKTRPPRERASIQTLVAYSWSSTRQAPRAARRENRAVVALRR